MLVRNDWEKRYYRIRKAIVFLADELREDPTDYAFPIKELTKILEAN